MLGAAETPVSAASLDGDGGQALTLDPLRSGFTRMFGHAALHSVSPDAHKKLGNLQEFS